MGVQEEGLPPWANGDGETWENFTFRAERLAPEHPGLAGKDLTPLGLLELERE